jgi:hypothetical protein
LGNGELASLAYGSFKELHKFAGPSSTQGKAGTSLPRSRRGFSTPFLGGFRARSSAESSADLSAGFAPVFDRHFRGSFSVGHRP